jgi:hypothetical protein
LLRGGSSLGLFAAILASGCSSEPDPPKNVGNPYPSATEVRLFVETGHDGEGRPVLSKAAGRTLTAKERQDFERTLRIEPAPDEYAACFIPHHFFAYFDAQGRKIGEIEVCFCCAGVQGLPDIATPIGPDDVLSADYPALEKLVQSMGEPTDIEC